MRQLGQIESKLCKITVFQSNHKYLVKFETRDYEQTYRIREGKNANNMADIKRIVNEDFITSVMGRFKQMNNDFVKALTGARDEDEDEFDMIL